MKEIFTDLYKRVAGFFQAPPEKENVKDVACNRLKFVLMQDRTNLNPQLLERMRNEMIDLLSKYVEMDKEALELNFEQEGDSMALMLSIPVLRAKEEDEIQAIIDAEEETKAKLKEETDKNKDKCSFQENEEGTDNVLDDGVSEEIIEEIEEDLIEHMNDDIGEATYSCDTECECIENNSETSDEIIDIEEKTSVKNTKKKNS